MERNRFGMLIAATTSNVITAATAHSAFRRLVIKPSPPSLSIFFLPEFCCFDYRTNLPGKLASWAKTAGAVLLPEHSTATIDPDFARDVEAAVESHREPLEPPAWD